MPDQGNLLKCEFVLSWFYLSADRRLFGGLKCGHVLHLYSWPLGTLLSACSREGGRVSQSHLSASSYSFSILWLPPPHHSQGSPPPVGWLSRDTEPGVRGIITVCKGGSGERWWQRWQLRREGSKEQMGNRMEKGDAAFIVQEGRKWSGKRMRETKRLARWGDEERELGIGTKIEKGKKVGAAGGSRKGR